MFTTAAALALIGADYKFRTTVETTGTLDRYGRLNGDLVLVGRGDPNLSGRELPYDLRTQRNDDPIQALESLADALVQKGVKFIDGDIVADDSYFAFERYGEGWSQDDLVWADGAPVSALTINDNVVFVNILPADRPGEKAFVSVKPFADYYRLDNRIITTPAGRRGIAIRVLRRASAMICAAVSALFVYLRMASMSRWKNAPARPGCVDAWRESAAPAWSAALRSPGSGAGSRAAVR